MDLLTDIEGSDLSTTREVIDIGGCRQIELLDPPVVSSFCKDVYLREIFMAKGSYVIGKMHKTEHFNIILKGQAYVMIDDTITLVTAPMTFVSKAGQRKILWVVEDMIWQTVHMNPDNITDVDELEERLIDKEAVLDTSLLLPPSVMVEIGEME